MIYVCSKSLKKLAQLMQGLNEDELLELKNLANDMCKDIRKQNRKVEEVIENVEL